MGWKHNSSNPKIFDPLDFTSCWQIHTFGGGGGGGGGGSMRARPYPNLSSKTWVSKSNRILYNGLYCVIDIRLVVKDLEELNLGEHTISNSLERAHSCVRELDISSGWMETNMPPLVSKSQTSEFDESPSFQNKLVISSS
jgi:hypothetical protein